MFTGIVEEVGRLRERTPVGLVIEAKLVLEGANLGDSICVNGVCLTATRLEDGCFSVDIVPETLRRSNLGRLSPGDPVNLERALAANGRFGGHVVQGHVESTGTVMSIDPDGEAALYRFGASESVMRYIVAKGFIAVDGVSLTVVSRKTDSFEITLIPFTREHTNLGGKQLGDSVNLETDVLARYVESLIANRE
jgi:riboflavin synthase